MKRIFLIALMFLCGINLQAQYNTGIGDGYAKGVLNNFQLNAQWTQTGLTNLSVYSLAVSGSNIFAGTSSEGVFLSTNNGSGWTAVNSGLLYYPVVISLAVSGSNIFAGNGNGVFLSTNNGSSWTAVNSGLTNSSVSSLAVSGSNIFAGTWGGGVFLSTNNGSIWTAVNTGLMNTEVQSLEVSGSNILAGTSGGVYISTNNGISWTEKGLSNSYVSSLTVSGSNIFAGTYGGGIFLSTNNGTNWTQVNSGVSYWNVFSLAVSGSNIFAGTDGGVFSMPLPGEIVTPTVPLLIAPINNAENQELNPTLTWATAENATAYNLQVSTSQDFAINIIDITGSTGTYYQTESLGYGIQYFWRVQAVNGNQTSAWSEVWSFITFSFPQFDITESFETWQPITGTLQTPPGEGVWDWGTTNVNTIGFTFPFDDRTHTTWSADINGHLKIGGAVSGAHGLRPGSLMIADHIAPYTWDADASSIFAETQGTAPNRVLVVQWNGFRYWTADGTQEGQMQVRLYENGMIKIVYGPGISGMTSENLGYIYICGDDIVNDFKGIVPGLAGAPRTIYTNRISPTSISQEMRQTLTSGKTYTIFNVEEDLSAPILTSPANNAVNQVINPELTWQAVSGASSYTLQVSTSQEFATNIINETIQSLSFSLSELANSTQYFWRVQAVNGENSSAWSLVWSFTTIEASPAVPALITPANNAAYQALSPTLTWEAAANATAYNLQVSTSQTFETTVINQTGITETSFQAESLANGTQYFWRVQAVNGAGSSPWSEVWGFTTTRFVPENTAEIDVNVLLTGLWSGTAHKPASVIVELRSGSSIGSSQLYKRSSGIINSNGIVSAKFKEFTSGTYWLIIRASGYLPIASLQRITVNSGSVTGYDFSRSAASTYQTTMQALSNGRYMMKAGDFDANRRVQSTDTGILKANIGGNTSIIPAE